MKRVIILGAGNSINELIANDLWERVKENDIWSCNYCYRTMPYLPQRQMWVDVDFWKANVEEMQKLHQQGVQLVSRNHHAWRNRSEIKVYGSTRLQNEYYGKHSIEKNTIFYGQMGLTGFFALSLAVAEDYKEIFLLGFDFGTSSLNDKTTHYYRGQIQITQDHSGVGHPDVYRNEHGVISAVQDFAVYLKETDVKIYNVSMNSNINYFEKIDGQTFFEKIKQ